MLRHLRLRRPLTFFDVETTGVDPCRDRIVEMALLRFGPGEGARALEQRFNPGRPIPAAASAVHGIRDEHVARCPAFADRAKQIACFLGDSDLAGFGVARFDLPFLVAEFERAGWDLPLRGRKVVDALTLFHRLEPRDLAAAVRRYCGREHSHAHRAGHDARAAVAVLDAMLGRHKEVPRAVNELHDLLVPVDVQVWFRREAGVVVFARGKHRGAPLQEVARHDASYLGWLAERVLPDARRLIARALRGGAC
jgi:DNA polymerase-3 subunit epsilon